MRWLRLRRPRLQFSLRMLLLLVTIFCVYLGGPLRRAHNQKLAVESLLRNSIGHDEIGYDFQLRDDVTTTTPYGTWVKWPGPYFDTTATPPGPEWLRRWVGRDYLSTVVQYQQRGWHELTDQNLQDIGRLTGLTRLIIDRPLTGAQLARVRNLSNLQYLHLGAEGRFYTWFRLEHLSGLTRLETLRLQATAFLGLEHLAALPKLRDVNLQGAIAGTELQHLVRSRSLRVLKLSHLDDEGVTHLGSLSQLEELDLSKVSLVRAIEPALVFDLKDHHLESIGKLRKLRRLSLGGTFVTDDGVDHLRGLTELEELDLTGTRVSSVGLAALRDMKRLRRLSLDGTRITDPGLKSLSGMTSMEELNLGGTRIGDAGLESLRPMKRLRILQLDETRISDPGLAALSDLKELFALHLNKNEIGNAGIARLQSLPKLTFLQLQETCVDDEGVALLLSMPALRTGWISWDRLTAKGWQQLRAGKPEFSPFSGASS
jgi:hypothetical protein